MLKTDKLKRVIDLCAKGHVTHIEGTEITPQIILSPGNL